MGENQEVMKAAMGVDRANCEACCHYERAYTSHEYPLDYDPPACHKKGREHVGNLKSFPFQTEQKCFEPDFWWTKYAEEINGDDEHDKEVAKRFREACDSYCSPTNMDFQTADYDDLCGCVSAPVPVYLGHLWKDASGKERVNHEATRRLIEDSKGDRVVLANCEKCGGSGLKDSPHKGK